MSIWAAAALQLDSNCILSNQHSPNCNAVIRYIFFGPRKWK